MKHKIVVSTKNMEIINLKKHMNPHLASTVRRTNRIKQGGGLRIDAKGKMVRVWSPGTLDVLVIDVRCP
jgi:hypothetical protein